MRLCLRAVVHVPQDAPSRSFLCFEQGRVLVSFFLKAYAQFNCFADTKDVQGTVGSLNRRKRKSWGNFSSRTAGEVCCFKIPERRDEEGLYICRAAGHM